MEYLVLNSYINLEKKKLKGWYKNIKNVGIYNLALFLIAVICCVCSFVFISLQRKYSLKATCISVAIEIICLVIINLTDHRDSILNSDDDIEKQDKKYENIKLWLERLGFKEKNQVKQLCRRCEIEIADNNEKNNKRKEFIDKLFNLFLIPIFVAVISWSFDLEGELSNRMAAVIETGMIWISLYIIGHGIIKISHPVLDKKYIKMCEMTKDIQGVLDRKFSIENEDIV